MTLAADEFIRRFLLHSLPDGFHRIRHYGFLANGHRAATLALCRQLLATPPPAPPPPTDYREHYRQLTGLSLGHRAAKLALCRQLLATPPPAPPPPTDYREHYRQLTGLSLEICPCCGGAMVPLGPLPRRCRQSMPIGFDSS